MKKIAIAALFAVLVLGCSPVVQPEQKPEQKPEQETPPEDDPPQEVSELNISLASPDPEIAWSLGGEALAQIASPGDWTLTSSESWLIISPSSGAKGSFSVTLTTPANSGTSDREAVLTLESAGESKQITIVQHGNIFSSRLLETRKLSSKMEIQVGAGINNLRYYVFLTYPETNQYQTIRDSEYGDGKLETSPEGVKYLVYYANMTPQQGSIEIEHTYTVDFQYLETDFSKIIHRDLPYDTESALYKRYTSRCTADAGYQMIDPAHPWVVSQAESLWSQSGGDPVEYARLCYEKVASAFSYGIYDGDNSVDEILDRMSGDCGNQHAVWLSLMRCKGIPARPVVMNSPDDFTHVRGEFCVAGYGWIPVDVTYHQGGGDYFGKFTNDHLVVMNRDFSFKPLPVGGESFHINLHQVVTWWYWYYGSGQVTGDYSLTYADIPEPVDAEWGITGTMVFPQWTTESPIPMTLEGNWWVARGVNLEASDKFKFIHNNSWDVNRGGTFSGLGNVFSMTQDGPDILPGINGSVDIYMNADTYQAYLIEAQ